MLYIFRLLLLLINIDQETVLNWFGIENAINQDFSQSNFETSTDISLTTFRLIFEGLWDKVQDGLTLADIENILFFILFIRFVILAIRYNLKTSVYITCIGLFAGYLWYKHLIDLISMYRSVLLKLPFLHKLGTDAIQIRSINRRMVTGDLKLGENVHWYNPGKVIYYAITKAVVNVDSETGLRYYIDPISMIISKLPESIKVNILPAYYNIYNNAIPKIFSVLSKFWNQLSGVAGYALITRIGKRYCPYLIRWHWTLLLIIGMVEQLFIYFVYRVYYFQAFVVVPQAKINSMDPNILLQVNFLNGIITFIVLTHIGLIIFGLFHAIWGQYFYIPFFVENTELHIGLRPTDSVYSGGNTAWQNNEKKFDRFVPKIWYGWFGRGTNHDLPIISNVTKFLKKMIKKLKRQFQK